MLRRTWVPMCTTSPILAFCKPFRAQKDAPDNRVLTKLPRFGPNTFPAFNSVIFSVEVQVEYLAKTLIAPILDGYARVIEVKPEAEEEFTGDLDNILATTVFAAGCSNWYINSKGRNSASWPGLASTFWKAAFFPKWKDFDMKGGSRAWLFNRTVRSLRTTPVWASLVVFLIVVTLFATRLMPGRREMSNGLLDL